MAKKTAKKLAADRLKRKLDRISSQTRREAKRRVSDAKKAWKQLAIEDRRKLVLELVETRCEELRLAYREDVIGVYASYKRTNRKIHKRTSRKMREVARRLPCVTFKVKRKRKNVAAHRRLPESLFAYHASGDDRTLCAVPTDVIRDETAQARPDRSPAQVLVRPASSPTPSTHGVMTGLLETPDRKRFVLSCLHVFGITGSNRGVIAHGATVRLASNSNHILAKLAKPGTLLPGVHHSFDVALATFEVNAGVRQALAQPVLLSSAKNFDDVFNERSYVIRTPDGDKRVTFFQKQDNFAKMDYGDDLPSIFLKRVILSSFNDPDDRTEPGSSGSPVMGRNRKLLGMHIGSLPPETIESGSQSIEVPARAVMIPAYDLTRSRIYGFQGTADLEFI
ncbi:MAG: hypothetical protein IID44_18565 [Planctomycetes bacterium]|nr:hypothetical protein [Planctomycetota bacterium]